MKIHMISQMLSAMMQESQASKIKRMLGGGGGVAIAMVAAVVIFYIIMWRFMKKTGRILLAFFLIACLFLGFCIITDQIGPNAEDMTYQYGNGELLLEGYIADEEVVAYSQPSENSDICWSFCQGDYVQVYEISGDWGRTRWGWVLLSKINFAELVEDDGQANSEPNGATKPQSTDPTATTNSTEDNKAPVSEGNNALVGVWHHIKTPIREDRIWFDVVSFTETNYSIVEMYVDLSDLDSYKIRGATAYKYTIQGNTLQGVCISDPIPSDEVSSVTFSMEYGLLVMDGNTYYSGDETIAMREIKALLGTEKEDQLPQSDHNQPLLGEWYSYPLSEYDGRYYFYMLRFTTYDNKYGWEDPAYYVEITNPTKAVMCGGQEGGYATVGNTIYRTNGNAPGQVFTNTISVNGDTLVWDGATYYRGSVDDVLTLIQNDIEAKS